LNKIIERKHKGKIDELRKLDITVSVWLIFYIYSLKIFFII
jgi:hypothetical protein